MTHGDEKSDPAMAAVKLANKSGQPDAELVEPRAGAKGNTAGHAMRRTPGRTGMSHALDRVRQAAKDKGVTFTALPHRVDAELLRSAYGWLRKEASPGADGVSWAAYGEGLEAKLTDLHDRIHRGAYRAVPSGLSIFRSRPAAIAFLQEWTRAPPGHSRAGGQSLSPDSIGGSSSARRSKCRTRSGRRISWGSATGSARGVASTMRWTRWRPGSASER